MDEPKMRDVGTGTRARCRECGHAGEVKLSVPQALFDAVAQMVASHVGDWIASRIEQLPRGAQHTEAVRGALVLVQAYVTEQMPAIIADTTDATDPEPRR